MQRVAIIGGTGMTGKCVVDYALKKGLQVKVLYRNEATLPESFKGKVDLIKGDATNYDDVKKVLSDVDGVVIVLGTRNKLEPTTEMSTGTQNIINAMKELGLKRFSICMSSFLFWDQSKVPPQFNNINNEHQKMLDLTKTSDLDYTAVLPPHIADEPPSEVQILHDSSPGRVVSKYDLAKFLVECLDLPEHCRQVCGIAKKS